MVKFALGFGVGALCGWLVVGWILGEVTDLVIWGEN